LVDCKIVARHSEKPIGTHVFTAVARNDAGLRWTAVTIDNGDNAKEPLSGETNYRTEFVAVLNNQPQGGFVTRRPTADDAVASDNFWGDDGLRALFQPNWNSQTGNTRRRGGQYYQLQRGWW
jgi:hypothetical protein